MEEFQIDAITFLGEQDGEPEKRLKSDLRDVLVRNDIIRAYLVRARYGDLDAISVALALVSDQPSDEIICSMTAVFQNFFSRDEHIDIMFVTPDQERELDSVCRPFFSNKR